MSYAVQTPQRPLPGTYIQTPAVSRDQSVQTLGLFPRSSSTISQPHNAPQTSGQALAPRTQSAQSTTKTASETLSPIERASKTINERLTQELGYPELDAYVGQGISSEYDISNQPAWAPFQKDKVYPIPDRIFEQYNRAQVSTMMGLFAELNYAWIVIDNACYLWDYTNPNPDLVGFEEQPNSITAVRLVVPRQGVFVPSITHLLIVATTSEMILVGLASQPAPNGGQSVALYQTHMSISIKGMDVNVIEGSAATGRIFFSGRAGDDVYELTYQQEEKWFQNRCAKVNHTGRGVLALAPSFTFSHKAQQEHTIQMAIDDSRRLVYTLSSRSTIRTFHMRPNGVLDLVIFKPLGTILNNIGHMTSQSELISSSMRIIAIHPISSQEASKLHLMATTSTGCRVFMSATSSYGQSITDPSNAPSSMQVQHVKFPPPEPPASQLNRYPNSTQVTNYGGSQGINTSSKALKQTRFATRYPPGYFFCFVSKDPQVASDALFVAAPDPGRIARPQEPSRSTRYSELGLWVNLGSRAEDIGLASPLFSAASSPTGFANELAVQFDKPAVEVAILTNTGIHTLRRRRLVDMFAAAIKHGGNDEGFEGEVNKFIRQYGRGETAATALAVACGQGLDIGSETRVAAVADPEVLEYARKAFIDFGGKPLFNENSVVDQTVPAIDMVRPSPRHEALSLYIARLVRSIWKAPVAQESMSPNGGIAVLPSVRLAKLQDVQRDLSKLQEFLSTNKSFIDGLAGPEALGRVSTKHEEVALLAEHRALHSLIVLISNVVEGISFVLVLFEERIEEIVLSLHNETRQQLRNLTYEGLFSSTNGRELAKELVKAIVNRNIANGSNVETVAEALRRRCGSFCSAEDVVIFKAQEQLKRAAESGSGSEFGRNLLNESLRLFKQVAASLSMEQLHWAVNQYLSMQFYAGAIQLALNMAKETDRGNRALTWIQEGRPEQASWLCVDSRAATFRLRKSCYDLVHQVITTLDQNSSQGPDIVDGQHTLASKRRTEAYDVIDTSEDEVFQTDLYDWYLAQGLADRLLDIQSPYIITYLQRKSSEDIVHADLLWRYYSQADRFHDAAAVQLALAKSAFDLLLDRRVEYLSRAKANASTYTPGIGRQTRQVLLREVSDLLDVANIQDDLLQRLKADVRIAANRKQDVMKELNGTILSLTELYNGYADQAGYFDLCILIYQAADHRSPTDIRGTWQNLFERTHEETIERGEPQPYEAVIEQVRSLGSRLNLSETTFPISDLVPLLERYAFEYQRGVGPPTWVLDTFLDLHVPHESVFSVLEGMFYNDEAPFQGRNRCYIANDILYVIQRWFHDSSRGTGKLFGDDSNVTTILQTLQMLQQNGLDEEKMEECQELRMKIDHMLR